MLSLMTLLIIHAVHSYAQTVEKMPTGDSTPSVCIGPQQEEHFNLAIESSKEALTTRGISMTMSTHPTEGKIVTEIISPNARVKTYADPCSCPSPVPLDTNKHLNLNIAQLFENPFHLSCLFPSQIQNLMRQPQSFPDEPKFFLEKTASGSFVNLSNIPQADADQLKLEHPLEPESANVASGNDMIAKEENPNIVDNVFHPINVILNSDRVYTPSSDPKVSVRIFIPDCLCNQTIQAPSQVTVKQPTFDNPNSPSTPSTDAVKPFSETAHAPTGITTPVTSVATREEPTQQNNPSQITPRSTPETAPSVATVSPETLVPLESPGITAPPNTHPAPSTIVPSRQIRKLPLYVCQVGSYDVINLDTNTVEKNRLEAPCPSRENRILPQPEEIKASELLKRFLKKPELETNQVELQQSIHEVMESWMEGKTNTPVKMIAPQFTVGTDSSTLKVIEGDADFLKERMKKNVELRDNKLQLKSNVMALTLLPSETTSQNQAGLAAQDSIPASAVISIENIAVGGGGGAFGGCSLLP